jgi:hypothetical protein
MIFLYLWNAAMKLLDSWTTRHGGAARTIELLHGDLANLPPEHAVDVLVVSAFPNDYAPTATSLVGALQRSGISVSALAKDKLIDMRDQFSCWLSRPVGSRANFRQMICIESGWRGTPLEITDDLFRALVPFLLTEFPESAVAMPIIGTGDQGYPREKMLLAILKAANAWFKRGLQLRVLKIVLNSERDLSEAQRIFSTFKQNVDIVLPNDPIAPKSDIHDVFISYSHADSDAADYVVKRLRGAQSLNIFYDQTSIATGASWLMKVANVLDSARRVVALYSPNYWASRNCQLEFAAALSRQNDTGEEILYPIYLNTAKIPYLFRHLNYNDCREHDRKKISLACSELERMTRAA